MIYGTEYASRDGKGGAEEDRQMNDAEGRKGEKQGVAKHNLNI